MKRLPIDGISIFIVSLVLRVGAITVPLNSDEAKWLSRGAIFLNSLLSGDLTGTYGSPHPGVPNMWLTGIGMVLNCRLHQVWPQLFAINQPELGACTDMLPFAASLYILPRLLQAVVTSACMVGIYWATRQLLGGAIALIAISLLTLEPFFLAYQRFVTTDALQSNFSMLAILLLLLYWRGTTPTTHWQETRPHRRLLLVSGICLGLATAAKIIGLFIVPGLVLWMALTELGLTQFPRRGWRRQLMDVLRWGGTGLATVIVIWPVLWIQPSYTVVRLVDGLLEEAERGDFFFLGEPTDSPGWLFYPVVLAFRLSPLVQFGVLAWLGMTVVQKFNARRTQARSHSFENHPKSLPDDAQSVLQALGLSALCILVILSAAQTKIDRYVTFVLPILTILAATGWLRLAQAVQSHWQGRFARDEYHKHDTIQNNSDWERIRLQAPQNREFRGQVRQFPTSILLIALIAGQLLILIPEIPYYITYYNPLVGGATNAERVLMLGQGEGLDRAAQWLNQHPDAAQLTVASWYRSVLAAYFHGQVLPIPKYREPDDAFWLTTNYVVFYVNQWQRSLPDADILHYFAVQRPQHTITIHGVDQIQIYPGPVPTVKDLAEMDVVAEQVFDDQVRLLGYDLNPQADGTVAIALYWEFLRRPAANAEVQITWGDRDETILEHRAPPLGDNIPLRKIPPNTILRDVHRLSQPIDEALTAERLQDYQININWVTRP
jgi:hypothetical protein